MEVIIPNESLALSVVMTNLFYHCFIGIFIAMILYEKSKFIYGFCTIYMQNPSINYNILGEKAMNRLFVLGMLLLTICISLVSTVFSAPSDIGDIGVYPKPPAPTLPPAGGSYLDPTFGTTIVRVTDRNNGDMNFHIYSTPSPFNADSTRFVIWSDKLGNMSGLQLYSFDPVNLISSRIRALFPSGISFKSDSLCWDYTNPNIMYGLDYTTKLYQYDCEEKTFTLIKDFAGILPPVELNYLTKSDDDRWFSFIVGKLNSNNGFLAAYDKQTDTIYQYDLFASFGSTNIHSATIDKSGKYVYANDNIPTEIYVWDIIAGTIVVLPNDTTTRPAGHRDMGMQVVYHVDHKSPTSVIKRDLNDPLNWTHVFEAPGGKDWTQGTHYSINSADERFLVAEHYSVPTQAITKPYQDEIFLIETDGSSMQNTKRLAHHRSEPYAGGSADKYSSQPHAALSIDGKFIMFGSNWDNSPYIDTFILKVDSSGGLDSTAPHPPTGLTIMKF